MVSDWWSVVFSCRPQVPQIQASAWGVNQHLLLAANSHSLDPAAKDALTGLFPAQQPAKDALTGLLPGQPSAAVAAVTPFPSVGVSSYPPPAMGSVLYKGMCSWQTVNVQVGLDP